MNRFFPLLSVFLILPGLSEAKETPAKKCVTALARLEKSDLLARPERSTKFIRGRSGTLFLRNKITSAELKAAKAEQSKLSLADALRELSNCREQFDNPWDVDLIRSFFLIDDRTAAEKFLRTYSGTRLITDLLKDAARREKSGPALILAEHYNQKMASLLIAFKYNFPKQKFEFKELEDSFTSLVTRYNKAAKSQDKKAAEAVLDDVSLAAQAFGLDLEPAISVVLNRLPAKK